MNDNDKKPVLVTTEHRGVFFGWIDPECETDKSIAVENCKLCLYWSTDVHGFLGLASHGPTANCRIGAAAPRVLLHDVTSVTDVSEEAVARWNAA